MLKTIDIRNFTYNKMVRKCSSKTSTSLIADFDYISPDKQQVI